VESERLIELRGNGHSDSSYLDGERNASVGRDKNDTEG
jgi:hypothetical protein